VAIYSYQLARGQTRWMFTIDLPPAADGKRRQMNRKGNRLGSSRNLSGRRTLSSINASGGPRQDGVHLTRQCRWDAGAGQCDGGQKAGAVKENPDVAVGADRRTLNRQGRVRDRWTGTWWRRSGIRRSDARR
jgi:hypothetical protein